MNITEREAGVILHLCYPVNRLHPFCVGVGAGLGTLVLINI